MIFLTRSEFNKSIFFNTPVPSTLPPASIESVLPESPPKASMGTILLNIAMVITIIPLFVKIFIQHLKEREEGLLIKELEKIKWLRFFDSKEIDLLILSAKNRPEKFKGLALSLVSSLPDREIDKAAIIKDLERGRNKEAFQKLKEHYQITSFYKAYAGRVQPINANEKMERLFEQAKAYKEGALKDKKEIKSLYRNISTLRSGFLIRSSLRAQRNRGEITPAQYQTLKEKIQANDNSGFYKEFKKILLQKVEEKEPNMGFFFNQEILKALQSMHPHNSIQELGASLTPLFYYQNLYTKLAMIEENLPLEREPLERLLKEAEMQMVTSLAADILEPPLFDYQFRALVGLVRKKLSDIDDKMYTSHEHCGCHHSYTTEKDILFQKQVVDIKKSRIHLEQKLLSTEGKIQAEKLTVKRDALKADIAAFKASEQGFLSLKPQGKKPRVLGITCSMGGGHKTATAAVGKVLGSNNAHFSVVDLLDDVLLSTSFFTKMGAIFGRTWKESEVFNFLLKKHWFWIPRFVVKMAKWSGKISSFFDRKKTEHVPKESLKKELIRKRLLMEMPDHVMTFYHMDLLPILEVAEEMGIPTTHFATDFSAKMDEPFGKIPPHHPQFKIVVGSDSPWSMETTRPIKKENVIVSAGPVRPAFLTKTDEGTLENMRKERGIDAETSTVLFMSGGSGQSVDFPEELAANMQIQKKLHLIVIAGSNKEFGGHFEHLVHQGKLEKKGRFYKGKNPLITIEVAKDPAVKTKENPYFIGERAMSRYFDLGDVLYTKPGGSTTFEGLAKGITILFDNRIELMEWERDNMEQSNGLKNSKDADFLKDLMRAIDHSKTHEKIPRNLPPITKVVQERMEEVHGSENAWQKNKFLHYRTLN